MDSKKFEQLFMKTTNANINKHLIQLVKLIKIIKNNFKKEKNFFHIKIAQQYFVAPVVKQTTTCEISRQNF